MLCVFPKNCNRYEDIFAFENILTPAQKKQGLQNSKQYFIFLFSQGRAHFHNFKKYKIY